MANPLRPTSRGTITLESGDPYDSPIIDPNYLSTKEDVLVTRASIRLARQVRLLHSVVLLLYLRAHISSVILICRGFVVFIQIDFSTKSEFLNINHILEPFIYLPVYQRKNMC